jgi:hypothetical protein
MAKQQLRTLCSIPVFDPMRQLYHWLYRRQNVKCRDRVVGKYAAASSKMPFPESRFRNVQNDKGQSIGWAVVDENNACSSPNNIVQCMKFVYYTSGNETGCLVLFITPVGNSRSFLRVGMGYLPMKKWLDQLDFDWFQGISKEAIILL